MPTRHGQQPLPQSSRPPNVPGFSCADRANARAASAANRCWAAATSNASARAMQLLLLLRWRGVRRHRPERRLEGPRNDANRLRHERVAVALDGVPEGEAAMLGG